MSTPGPRRPRLPRPSSPRALVVISVLCCGVLTACGSSPTEVTPGDADAGVAPSSASASTSTSPTAAASSGGPQVFTSDLESKAPVKATRAWAAAMAEEINARSGDHAQTRPLTTARGQRTLPSTYEQDYTFRYPGPLPFGARRLVVDGPTARLTACVMDAGWGLVRGSNTVPSAQHYGEYTFVLKRVSGAWKLDQFNNEQTECSMADLKGSR